MIECPKCHRTERQNRAGKTPSGSQRYRCMFCQIKYTPQPKAWAYPEEVRRKALQLYVDGMNLRCIARHLGIHHRTVSLWVQAQATQLPNPPVPSQVQAVEMDELFSFIGEKKRNLCHHPRRPADPLLPGFSSRVATNPRSPSRAGRCSTQGQALLQRCL
ncbi:MAG: helix-turn-helix domain-containing protein [Omnitrophica WOR_2 bacterium]